MKIYIVSIDHHHGNRAVAQAEAMGFEAEIIPGVNVQSVDHANNLIGYYPQPSLLEERYGPGAVESEKQIREMTRFYRREKVAIRKAMQKAAAHVSTEGGGIVMQEDVVFTEVPEVTAPFITYAGGTDHFCPRAFYVDQEHASYLALAWMRRTVNACAGWKNLVRSSARVESIVEHKRDV